MNTSDEEGQLTGFSFSSKKPSFLEGIMPRKLDVDLCVCMCAGVHVCRGRGEGRGRREGWGASTSQFISCRNNYFNPHVTNLQH